MLILSRPDVWQRLLHGPRVPTCNKST